MNAVIGILVFVGCLTAVRHWLGIRWRAGRVSARRAAAVVAAVWAMFPFVGLAGGAPWGMPVVVSGSAILFVAVFVSAYFLLSRFGKRTG
jgi:hypothetical protein